VLIFLHCSFPVISTPFTINIRPPVFVLDSLFLRLFAELQCSIWPSGRRSFIGMAVPTPFTKSIHMTADSRIEALEKQVAAQGKLIDDLRRIFIYSEGTMSAYQAAVQALLVGASSNENLDEELTKRLFQLEATTIASAHTEEQMAGFDEAREVVIEARTQATANLPRPASVS
jgi:uncharacterized coiled-coil protein SlyX